MKIGLEYPINEMRGGAVGRSGLVFFPWRGLQVARRYVTPSNPSSSNQVAVRSKLTAVSKDYFNISAAQKAGWENFAALYSREEQGKLITMPPNAAFMKVNSIRQLDAQAIARDAPTALPDFAVTDVNSFIITAGIATISVDHSASVTTGRKLLVEISSPVKSANTRIFDKDYRYAKSADSTGNIVALAASPQSIVITASDLWRTFAVGEVVGVRITPLSSTYATGTPYEETITIT